MCDLGSDNLIELNLEEVSVLQDLSAEPRETEHILPHPSTISLMHDLDFVSPSCRKRDSLDNNPFDCVQKLANNRQDDPFDIVEKEACFKALHSVEPPVEVKLGKLLSLSDENLLDTCDAGHDKESEFKNPDKNFDLESESPPVFMMEKLIAPDSCSETDSYPNSSADSAASSKMKKTTEYRKRLLKLSVTNSALNSPASRRSSLEDSDTPGTPLSSLLSRASQYGENMLASESPLKFVDDDIMSEEPPSLLLEAEKNFEADLEMLNIPMLNEIHSPMNEIQSAIEKKILDSLNDNDRPSTAFVDLEAIKAKLKAKREESNNNHHHDINSLISDLKSLINNGSSVDNGTKIQASSILETLSSALSSSHLKDNSLPQQQESLTVPQSIKRQGTFDIEIEDVEDLSQQPPVQDMPNCMTSSSATYDGETPEERLELQLPEIDPPSPLEPPSSETILQSDVNDIMEQLSKLLIHNNSGDGSQNTQQKPTFIVVMNTTPMPQNSTVSCVKDKSDMEKSFHDGPSDLNISNCVMTRRRAHSLSIHDKVKIVQLPLKSPNPQCLQKQHNSDVGDSSPVSITPPPNDLDTPEFKTPSRRIRRNSYSSGTPCTAAVSLKNTVFSSDGKTITYIRRTQTLDTHHEGHQQQKAVVRPMTMPTHNVSSFKLDLKKKHKSHNESIMKSSEPLKATVPVKKVAPMIKTSPPSPGQDSPIIGGRNSSHHKRNKIPTTPMGASRSSKLSVGPGYPNACSTPSGFTSPLKRASAGVTKPRYSYMSATPNPKATLACGGSAALKRRTITEFKVRSPLKPRVSSAGLAVAAASAASTSTRLSTTTSSRLSTSTGAKLNSKTPTKLAPNTAAVRPTGRFGSSRLSSVGSSLTNRNKENKHP